LTFIKRHQASFGFLRKQRQAIILQVCLGAYLYGTSGCLSLNTGEFSMKSRLTGNALKLYHIFKTHKKLTDIELLLHSNINPNSVRPARLLLEKNNLIKRTNEKKNHNTSSKRISLYSVYELIETESPKLANNQNKNKSVIEKIKALTEELTRLVSSLG
jgi:transcription initiation factor IIE alpha subunit